MGLSAQPVAAHVDVQPRIVEQGVATDLVVELPRLRPGKPPTRVELEGAGVEVLSSRLRELVGSESRWDVRVRADAPSGRLEIVLRAGFAGGETVEVDDTLIVVPSEAADPFPWTAAVVGTGLAAGFAMAALLLVRRRRSA